MLPPVILKHMLHSSHSESHSWWLLITSKEFPRGFPDIMVLWILLLPLVPTGPYGGAPSLRGALGFARDAPAWSELSWPPRCPGERGAPVRPPKGVGITKIS